MKNVILFPNIKSEHIIEQAHEAFLSGEYEAAINLYEALFLRNITSYEIHWNYLVSLKNNEQLEDAVEYAKEFVEYYTGEQQFMMIEFAVMIMLEAEDYLNVALFIRDMLQLGLQDDDRQKLLTLLTITDEQNKVYRNELLAELDEAIQQSDHQKAWLILYDIHISHMQPQRNFTSYLINPKVHPVVKTKMLDPFKIHQYSDAIRIEKFGKEITVKPNELTDYHKEQYVIDLVQSMEIIEQDNPSLHKLIREMIKQYAYVMYPFQKSLDDIASLKEAFIIVGERHLSSVLEMEQVDEEIATHIYNIEMCLQLYVSISNPTF